MDSLEKVKESDLASVWPDATGWLVAVRLPRIEARLYPYILMQYNPKLYSLIFKLLPGCAVTSGYGKSESFLRLQVGRDLARQILKEPQLPEPQLGEKLAAFCHEHDKDFREIEDHILAYFKENAEAIARWKGMTA